MNIQHLYICIQYISNELCIKMHMCTYKLFLYVCINFMHIHTCMHELLVFNPSLFVSNSHIWTYTYSCILYMCVYTVVWFNAHAYMLHIHVCIYLCINVSSHINTHKWGTQNHTKTDLESKRKVLKPIWVC